MNTVLSNVWIPALYAKKKFATMNSVFLVFCFEYKEEIQEMLKYSLIAVYLIFIKIFHLISHLYYQIITYIYFHHNKQIALGTANSHANFLDNCSSAWLSVIKIAVFIASIFCCRQTDWTTLCDGYIFANLCLGALAFVWTGSIA